MVKSKRKKNILVVDDEVSHRVMLRANLEGEGYLVYEAEDGERAVEMAAERSFDCILMDIRMPRMDGISALRKIKDSASSVAIVMMTAYGSVSTAVESLKSGAEDYVMKPVNIDELLIKLGKIMEFRSMEKEILTIRERLGERFDFSNIIGSSTPMRELYELLSMVAPTDATVLLLGESGTGKELVANAIHQNSGRKEKPFLKVNCAALPENLLESELFGHEKGAFTGAVGRKDGRFKAADGGTIFLDEIAEMSTTTQAKILRVLQEREFESLGSNKTIGVDVRVIAATNRDLQIEVESGEFREDLYYRLNVVPVLVPPLRERREDIPRLIEHFTAQLSSKIGKKITGVRDEALSLLKMYAWPGNVRELENVIERAVIMSRSEQIDTDNLPESIRNITESDDEEKGRDTIAPGITLKNAEKLLITETLKQTGGNRTRCAEILGITRRTLQNKIKEYNIDI